MSGHAKLLCMNPILRLITNHLAEVRSLINYFFTHFCKVEILKLKLCLCGGICRKTTL